MERIICDSYVKGDLNLWTLEAESLSTQQFNRRITAVNEMFGWLYEQGILEKVSFEFKDYSDITYFAFDAADLAPYREAMLASGRADAELAVHHIFDEPYTPCMYSGAIELGWTMFSYRDFDGTVGRSWECGLCQHLNAASVLDIEEVKSQKGIKEAVKYAFELSGFKPSDLVVVRALTEDDREAVERLDQLSDFEVENGLDSENYAWGVFVGSELAGFCTIGGADDPVMRYDEFEEWWDNRSLCLSDVFVKEEHRHKGLATRLISEALGQCVGDDETVFLSLLDDGLAPLYENLGFEMLADGVMVRPDRKHVLFKEACEYYDIEITDDEFLVEHCDHLIYCYQNHKDLIDFDFITRYEFLLGEKLSWDEYLAIDSAFDGDPHDVEPEDVEMVASFRESLEAKRAEDAMCKPLGDKIAEAEGQKENSRDTDSRDIHLEYPF